MEERDPYTAGHSRRVRATRSAWPAPSASTRGSASLLSLAAKLHDIGKVGVPDAILNKPGALTADEECASSASTPSSASASSRRSSATAPCWPASAATTSASTAAATPTALRGDQIPLLARLIAIPDCFDALTTSRAYRAALPVPQALAILREGSGTHFEPALVQAFLKIVPHLPFVDYRCVSEGGERRAESGKQTVEV